MTDLNEEYLTEAVFKMQSYSMEMRIENPKHLNVPNDYVKAIKKLLYYKPPIKKVSGMRKKKRAYYWRGKC